MAAPDISLELFQILDAIDRRGSFAAAAEELGKVASALSYSIQKHEQALGVSLFVRAGRRSVFTPVGRLLLERGRAILGATASLADEAVTLAKGWEPRIRIAVDSLVPLPGVMAVLAEFIAGHPDVEIDLREEVLGGAWEALIEDRVQLVIGAPAPVPTVPGIRAERLGTVSRVLAVSADHPLARQAQPLRAEDIAPHRMVIVHDSSRTGIPRANRLLNRDRHFYVQTFAQKIAAQRAGIGVGFVPREAIADALTSGEMVALAVEGVSLEDELFLAWKTANRGQGLKLLREMLLRARLLG
ncbi:MAG: LysR substrate-binding domain-containing protein [Porticoccaceae bacterium]|jgi:DNA-binding transcriptional LysR family regulator|nr:LysR substrate-binding domain-containing protein [Porticoccaceae bacterium]MEA3299322.1 LysR substrate-binding domain-containing protein [Pseudomonadota bacterium]HLS98066.1 LysR substrate-binding domain-containing protein [Porticoccaceae bacterium]